VLEATAFQTREVLEAMEKDSGITMNGLKVDGGMVVNNLLMQFQADQLGVPVVRPKVAETTSLGAAYAAGLALGYWKDFNALRVNWQKGAEWVAKMDRGEADRLYFEWKKAVTRTFNWID
jgi:glycerol kinase